MPRIDVSIDEETKRPAQLTTFAGSLLIGQSPVVSKASYAASLCHVGALLVVQVQLYLVGY